ncbi:MAG TPA: thiamine pyrophosphate-dependent enzyme, partial [Tepidisphaeraceae bacterium]
MKVDPRFVLGEGREVFNGNELLVKGCLETPGGVSLYSGYPGSPVATFFDCLGYIKNLITAKGLRAFQANNEALGVAALNGSQMLPVRGIVAMKSVGLHVASDALALGNLAGPHPEGGAVVICGDDPWCDSTQVPADSRFLCEHLRMPVIEPGTAQEIKDWIGASFQISREANLYIGYIVTTTLADGGGTVTCYPNHYPELSTTDRITLETARIDLERVLLPPRTWMKELEMPGRHKKACELARQIGVNRIIPATRSDSEVAPLGFITTGMSRSYLEQVLADAGLAGVFPILNMGMPYPADVEIVRDFAKTCQKMVVIEERRSFLEKNLRDNFFKELPMEEAAELAGRLYGKKFPRNTNHESRATDPDGIPEGRGLTPSLTAQLILPLIQRTQEIPEHLRNGNISAVLDLIKVSSKRKLDILGIEKVGQSLNTSSAAPAAASGASSGGCCSTKTEQPGEVVDDEKLLARLPTFCPGCPHRDSSAALLEMRKNLADEKYMRRWHKRGPVDLVAHGDTGCYTMLMFPPTQPLMHNYSGMGLGAGTGSGVDAFIKNKQIVFMGDGTFYHSGQVAISNSIKAGQDITFIILENGTTAMTGHQEHPGTERDVLGNSSYIQD